MTFDFSPVDNKNIEKILDRLKRSLGGAGHILRSGDINAVE